ncbi:MAG: flagellar export protein FliJ [Proteobacteria bacterium]|nr:flagellar export protein FliJ [Pseudomonadota bacterium]
MTKPFQLQTLLNLAQIKNESATRRLGELNKQQHETQIQLETLQQYRLDYQTRMQTASQQGMNPAMLRNFQEFIYKLDAAITQQIKVVEQSKLSTQAGRGEYANAQRKLKSFGTLQQRYFEHEQKVETKQEQKAMDEHTGRATAYKMLNTEK